MCFSGLQTQLGDLTTRFAPVAEKPEKAEKACSDLPTAANALQDLHRQRHITHASALFLPWLVPRLEELKNVSEAPPQTPSTALVPPENPTRSNSQRRSSGRERAERG